MQVSDANRRPSAGGTGKWSGKRSGKRKALSRRIWKDIAGLAAQRGVVAEYPWVSAKEEGYGDFVVLWDHWQEGLDGIVELMGIRDATS